MKKALYLLIVGALLSGVAAYAASAADPAAQGDAAAATAR